MKRRKEGKKERMNKHIIKLNDFITSFSVPRIKALLNATVHTVLFLRLTCLVKPLHVMNYVEYVEIDDVFLKDMVTKHIEDVLNEISQNVNEREKESKIKETVTLDILQNIKKKGWIGLQDDLIEYENWILPLVISSPNDKNINSDEEFTEQLKNLMNHIIEKSQSYETVMFSKNLNDIKINISYQKDKKESIFDNILNILKSKPVTFTI